LNHIKNNATLLCLCSAEPASVAEAITTYDGGAGKYELAMVAIDSSDFTGPTDDETNGRKITIGAQEGITPDAAANATHVAIVNGGSPSELLWVTTCTSKEIVLGDPIDTPAFKIRFADPV
jgi:hypothetical protein